MATRTKNPYQNKSEEKEYVQPVHNAAIPLRTLCKTVLHRYRTIESDLSLAEVQAKIEEGVCVHDPTCKSFMKKYGPSILAMSKNGKNDEDICSSSRFDQEIAVNLTK